MTTAELKTARLANRAKIKARLQAFQLPDGAKPVPTYKLISDTERAALAAAENAKPKPKACC
jgi:hypothetical protein